MPSSSLVIACYALRAKKSSSAERMYVTVTAFDCRHGSASLECLHYACTLLSRWQKLVSLFSSALWSDSFFLVCISSKLFCRVDIVNGQF